MHWAFFFPPYLKALFVFLLISGNRPERVGIDFFHITMWEIIERACMSQMKMLYLCLIVIHSLLYGSEVPLGMSQIHIMFLSAGFGIWISDLAVRYVKSHVARQLPGDSTAANTEELELSQQGRWAFIYARTALPLSCPLAAPSNFKCGSEGSVGRIQEDSLLKPKGGNFQRSHMPLRETTVIPRQLRPSHSPAQYNALPHLPFSFSGSFTQWPCS